MRRMPHETYLRNDRKIEESTNDDLCARAQINANQRNTENITNSFL